MFKKEAKKLEVKTPEIKAPGDITSIDWESLIPDIRIILEKESKILSEKGYL